MKYKFSQMFVLYSNIGQGIQAVSELYLKHDQLTEISKNILIAHVL